MFNLSILLHQKSSPYFYNSPTFSFSFSSSLSSLPDFPSLFFTNHSRSGLLYHLFYYFHSFYNSAILDTSTLVLE